MIYGLLIGIGAILPGVSGGVIAVVLGIYDRIIFGLNNFRKDKKELIFIVKLLLGIILGIILSANILKYFFNLYRIELSYLFIGLILGTIPLLIKNYNEKCKVKLNYLLIIFVTLLSLIFSIIVKDNISLHNDNKILLFIAGILFAIGKIVPGISSSVLLSLIGKYNLFLSIFSNPIDYLFNNYLDLIIIIVGVLFGALFSVKIISYLLNKYYSKAYSIIIGFVIGSIYSLYPNSITFPGIMFLLIGFVFSLGIIVIKR